MSDDKTIIQREMETALQSGEGPAVVRFIMSCFSGVPIAGGPIGAVAGAWSEAEQNRFNHLLYAWLKLQEEEIREIGLTMYEVVNRVDSKDEEVKKRMESPEYLRIVKKCFRDWSAAESEQKRRLVRNLLANAAATRIVKDDMVMLFVTWIADYSEAHFEVIREVYHKPGIDRSEISQKIYESIPREDSSEADLFKLIFHDLSVGHIIRQHREKDASGNFLKKQKTRQPKSQYIKSAFDGGDDYELTELGLQFVHYTMNEETVKITEKSPTHPRY